MNPNIISLNKNLNKLKKFYKERKFSIFELNLILDDMLCSLSNNKNFIKQTGGYDPEKFLKLIKDFKEKIATVNTQEFKDFIKTLQDFIDIFKITA